MVVVGYILYEASKILTTALSGSSMLFVLGALTVKEEQEKFFFFLGALNIGKQDNRQ